uniref:Putative plectrovirus spv1-c74 orf 1 n-terminal truncated transmembrane protein n=1 Tax=Spiroplasma citri TaxID=2133 RepID=Q14KW2_SPICI|nr:putative plectrovirus spv1-c74 orf 1 n-terminal truncated transmembrane protein [Spiroplasma citri]
MVLILVFIMLLIEMVNLMMEKFDNYLIKKGAWYRLDIHIENAAIWIVNNLPGMKEIYKFVNGIIHVFSNVSELFNNIGNLFAFDITFKIMLSSILVLAMVNGLLRYF